MHPVKISSRAKQAHIILFKIDTSLSIEIYTTNVDNHYTTSLCSLCEFISTAPGVGDIGDDIVGLLEHL